MSSPRDSRLSLDSDDGGESGSVELAHRDSTVAKLRRLASNPDYQKASQANLNIPPSDDSVEDIRVSAAASKITDILRRPSVNNADIRMFIEKEYHKTSASRELIRHLVFLVVFLAGVTLHRAAFQSYLLNQALITSFVTQQIEFDLQQFPKTYLDVGQPDEFVSWFISVLGGTLDQKEYYNGQNMTEDEQNYIMFSNRLIGGVRLRQLRVAPNRGCTLPYQLRAVSKGICYDYGYSADSRETRPFGPPEDPERYTYQSPAETGSEGVFGYVLDYLDGGGYVVDANINDKLNGTSYTEAFQQLIDDKWIDRQTRAVIITMTFLNLELESRVAVMYLIIEIPGDGVFYPNYQIKTFRLNLYVTGLDYFRLFLEIVFLLFVLYSIYCEGIEMINNFRTRHTGKGLKKYFYNGWNIIELIDIALYITVVGLYVKYMVSHERQSATLTNTEYSSDMESLAAVSLGFYNVCAFNVIITTFRTFKFLKLNHRLYLLWKTLRHAGMDLIGFLFIFLIFIFGFIFMGWLAFGADLVEFNTFFHAFSTCWNFIIGNAPDYNAMYISNRILGPAFFVMFTIFIFFILANMFIAILSNSFEVVSESEGDKSKLKDIFEEKVQALVGAFKQFYLVITKKDSKKRPITEILDNLAKPEILDRPNLSRSDIARAIGENATESEIDDLHNWVKKLETRKNKRGTVNGTLSKGLMADFEHDEDATLMRSNDAIPSPLSHADGETKAALKDMQIQMQELQQLIRRLTNTKENKND